MKLKVLGSDSSGNCYLLQGDKETLIIECGVKYKEILKGLGFNISKVVGCLVSHEHKDHCKAIDEIIRSGIDVYLSLGTKKAIDCKAFIYKINHQIRFIESEQQFKVGGFTVLPFATEHDAAEPLGFLIEHKEMGKLLFITDSYYCQYQFSGINHILLECNYSKEILEEKIKNGLNPVLARRLLKSHFSLDNVKEFLEATDLSQVKDITLIHLSSNNSNASLFQEEIEKLTGKITYVAKKGLEIEL